MSIPKHPTLSKRATALLHRLYDERFYPDATNCVGPVMQELLDAGLVVSGGRVAKIVRCYMPKGVKPFKCEKYPEKPEWLKSSH